MHVGAVRVQLIAAGDPLIQDAVITGHDRDEIGALVFLSPAAKDIGVRGDAARASATSSKKLAQEARQLDAYPARLLVMTEPPSIDANEITDKGYMNQRAVLERRAALVEKLYAATGERSLFLRHPEPGDGADGEESAGDLQRRHRLAEDSQASPSSAIGSKLSAAGAGRWARAAGP